MKSSIFNIQEVFLGFKKVNPDVQKGFSKFCELRPKYVVNINSNGIHKVCVCEYHQNVKLMLLSLTVKTNYKDVICKAVCNTDARNLCYMFVKTLLENKVFKIIRHIGLQIMKMNLVRTYCTCSGYPLTEQ